MTQLPAYQELARRHLRMHRLGHLQSIAHWDRSANMPAKGNEARAAALAEMGGLLHELATAADLPQLLGSAEGEALGEFERASLREMRRAWIASNALPTALVERAEPGQQLALRTRLDAPSARPTTGPATRPLLTEVLELVREEAHAGSARPPG
jgi:carboxypeptidase Taq